MAICMRIEEAKTYPGFTLYPHYHTEKMPWAAAAVIPIEKVEKIIWLAVTGRDPETDREPRNWEEERAGVGKWVKLLEALRSSPQRVG